jgi:hypothetical protein
LTRLLYLGSHRRSRGAQAAAAPHQAIVAEAVPELPLYSVTKLDAVPARLSAEGQPDHGYLLERTR